MQTLYEVYASFDESQKDWLHFTVGCIINGYSRPPISQSMRNSFGGEQWSAFEFIVAEARKRKS